MEVVLELKAIVSEAELFQSNEGSLFGSPGNESRSRSLDVGGWRAIFSLRGCRKGFKVAL